MHELKKEEEFIVELNGISKKLIARPDGSIVVDGMMFFPQIEVHGKNFHVHLDDSIFQVEEHDGRVFLDGKEVDFTFRQAIPTLQRKSSKKTGEKTIRAVIPGVIVELLVKEGDAVLKDQPLLYLEAMKMRNEIRAPVSGVVKKIFVETGASVRKDDELLVISQEEGGIK